MVSLMRCSNALLLKTSKGLICMRERGVVGERDDPD